MSAARNKLVLRADLLRAAAVSPDLASKPPVEAVWNEHARLVKAALCISAFTALEDFVQARIREIVVGLSGCAPTSRGLPEPLKHALVAGAFESLIVRSKSPEKFGITDVRSYLISQSERIASFGRSGLDPSDLALANNGSNLSWKSIEDALIAFAVENPPSVMNGVARRIEGGIFIARDHFESVLNWRHKVAHVADTDVPLADVRGYVEKLTLFCAAFDFVLSTAASRVFSSALASAPPVTRNIDVTLRFVERQGGRWRDIVEGKRRGASRNADRGSVVFTSEALARTHAQCVLVRRDGPTSATEFWRTPFI